MLNFRHAALAPLVAVIAFVISGCTPSMQAATETVRVAISGTPPVTWTRAQMQALPYAQLRLDSKLGSAVLVLGRVVDGQRFWAAPGGYVLVEADGLVMRVSGFADSLESSRFIGHNPFATGLHHLTSGTKTERVVDWMPGNRYGVILQSSFSQLGRDHIEILGEQFETLYIEEQLHATNANFQAVNRYWVSPVDGYILKSEQQITPSLRLNLTTLRRSQPGTGA